MKPIKFDSMGCLTDQIFADCSLRAERERDREREQKITRSLKVLSFRTFFPTRTG